MTTTREARWLSVEQQGHWRTFRDGVSLLFDALGHDLEERCGLSIQEYEVMVRLSEAPDRTLRITVAEIDRRVPGTVRLDWAEPVVTGRGEDRGART